MHKKPLILLIFLTFLFSFCSGCVKNLENCKIFPKIEVKIDEKNESNQKNKKTIDAESTSAEVSCNF